jgi:SSS family solute:Na+ symporter
MHWIDWILVALPVLTVLGFAVYTNRYVRSVADFLSGGRCAGRYLLANAKGESESGLSNSMARFEMVLISGFVLNYWEKLYYPVVLLIGISGFVVYRFRETRAMTLAQFFEIRYSKSFRLFMGMLAFVSGILNYGVFPAISARFFIYFLDLPLYVSLFGFHASTLALIMASYLTCTVVMVLTGGQATMMITDCLEGLLSQLIYVVVAIAVFFIVSWTQIVQVMEAAPPGHSLIDPFDTGKVPDFNIWFIAMGLFIRIYSTSAFQGKQGFNSAARTPHEQRMGGVLGEWRGYARTLMLLLLGLCAITYLRHPAFAQQSVLIYQAIGGIGDEYIRKQMTVPIALRYLLPIGIKGLFCSMMVMGLLAGDGGHLHSWGSIFIQDVLLPFRKRALSPREHIWMIRLAVMGVAAFAFFFSLVFPQTQYIALWWFVTGAVFTGGAGAAIIGGLYWKKGTTAAAWAAAIVGSVLSFGGILCGSIWPQISAALNPLVRVVGLHLPEKFWFNNQVSAFGAAVIAAGTYIVVSLLTSRADFNLDRMLHRGRYAIEADRAGTPPLLARFRLSSILRFDREFTFWDKVVSGGIFWWAMALVAVNLVVSAWNLLFGHRWPVEWWAHYWMITGIALPCVISVATLVWFSIGGVIDMKAFFKALRIERRDARDDGRVTGHHNLVDEGTLSPEVTKPVGESASASASR